MNIVGIAGLPRSGKDTLAKWFVESGYFGVSLGDIVREQSRQRHASKNDPISVANMTETANYLREKSGADTVLKQALELYEKASTAGDYVGLAIYSVRTPAEADFITSHNGRLIWVEASDDVRYARSIENSRPGEDASIDMDTFLAHEQLQWQPKAGVPEEAQMNVSYVKQNSTDIIENNDDVATFQRSAREVLQSIPR